MLPGAQIQSVPHALNRSRKQATHDFACRGGKHVLCRVEVFGYGQTALKRVVRRKEHGSCAYRYCQSVALLVDHRATHRRVRCRQLHCQLLDTRHEIRQLQ